MDDQSIIAIRKEDSSSADEAFAELMSKTENSLNQKARDNIDKYKNLSSFGLEKESLNEIKDSCIGTPFNPDNVILVSGQKFPDIVAEKYYGVEVKSTDKNHWTSTGSSIVETTRVESVENIYMLFGKLGGTPAEFKCRPYQEVLSEIAVTHSPRYLIDMTLQKGESIFDKIGEPYDTFRKSGDQIKIAKLYYKKKSKKNGLQMPWWISSDDESSTVGMNVRLWRGLPPDEKKSLTAQMTILFPEVILGKYGNAALWLASAKGVVCGNIRDPFSAGGKVRVLGGKVLEVPLPQIVRTLASINDDVKSILSEPEELSDFISEYNPGLCSGKESYEIWLEQVEEKLEQKHVDKTIYEILQAYGKA